jgi:hypothetical protein
MNQLLQHRKENPAADLDERPADDRTWPGARC